jgi:hypothetical protein
VIAAKSAAAADTALDMASVVTTVRMHATSTDNETASNRKQSDFESETPLHEHMFTELAKKHPNGRVIDIFTSQPRAGAMSDVT